MKPQFSCTVARYGVKVRAPAASSCTAGAIWDRSTMAGLRAAARYGLGARPGLGLPGTTRRTTNVSCPSRSDTCRRGSLRNRTALARLCSNSDSSRPLAIHRDGSGKPAVLSELVRLPIQDEPNTRVNQTKEKWPSTERVVRSLAITDARCRRLEASESTQLLTSRLLDF